MRGARKLLSIVALALISLALLTACGKKLTPPSNLQVSETTLTWNSVLNATGYVVNIDGNEKTVETNEYSLADLTESKTYQIKIKAVDSTKVFEDSDWSKILSHTVEADKPITYTLILQAGLGGTVDGGGLFEEGKKVTVTAKPDTGFSFEGWYEENAKVSQNPAYTFDMPANSLILEAGFLIYPNQKEQVTVLQWEIGFTTNRQANLCLFSVKLEKPTLHMNIKEREPQHTR